MNYVNLIGKMSSAPKIVELANGRKIVKFSLTTNELVLDPKGETKKKTQWHRISAWGKWVAVLEQLGSAGIELAIEGKINTRFFQLNGKKACVSEIEVNDLVIL